MFNLIFNNVSVGYEPAIDPSLVNSWQLGIVGLWSFDSFSSNTSPDISLGNPANGGPVSAINNGATYLPTGGRYNGGFRFNKISYVSIPKGALEQNVPSTTGYSMSFFLSG
jgi:hypothetical protein